MLHASVGDCRSLKRVENAVSSFALLPVGSVGWAWAGREGGGLIRVTEMILTQALSNVNFGYKCFDFHLLF